MYRPTSQNATAGFTLVEMVIVGAVMAILAGVSTPPIIQFMQQRDVRNEQIAHIEIRKALAAYIEERGAVPDDTITDTANVNFWANQLAGYTNMSPGQIRLDEWDRPRAYSAYQATEFVLGSAMPIFYVTVASAGTNRNADATTGLPVGTASGGLVPYAAPTNTGWWSRVSAASGLTVQETRIRDFTQLTPEGDDIVIKLTDYPQKMEAYKSTLDRLTRIGEALDSYAKSAYAERSTACLSATCSPTPEQQIYFPRAGTGPENVGDTAALYANTRGAADLTTYNGGAVINNGSTHATRRTQMINLMRILGLPDDYCCSALEVIPGTIDAITGKPQAMPFYYFSNPRARINGTTCATTRPNASQRKLPARVTTQYINTGVTNPTCG